MPYTDKPLDVLKSISPKKSPYPIYLLAGEEPYFTDKIERKLVATYMPEEARDFNYTLLYGSSVSVQDIIAACRRVPLGSERTLVVVREAQELMRGGDSDDGGGSQLAPLIQLLEHPNPQNVLILSVKGKRPNRRVTLFKRIEKDGLFVDSSALKERQVLSYVPGIAEEHGLMLQHDAVAMVAEHIGTDLQRMDSEMEKLATALTPEERGSVTKEQVLKYTGLNKEYSIFDLKSALARKDRGRAMQIAMAFAADERKTPVQMVIPVLFGYFSDLLVAFYAKDKSEQGVMAELGIERSFLVKDYMLGLRHYRANKVAQIITYLRRCDARSKGMYSDEGAPDEILIDLVLFILN